MQLGSVADPSVTITGGRVNDKRDDRDDYLQMDHAHNIYSTEFEQVRVATLCDATFRSARKTWKRLLQDFPVRKHHQRRLVGLAFEGAAKRIFEDAASTNLHATAEELWGIL